MPEIKVDDTFTELVMFDLDGADARDVLLKGILQQAEDWIRHLPGFISASFHVSQDGRHLFN